MSQVLDYSGSRWVTHKLSAMKWVLSKFGAYTEEDNTDLDESAAAATSSCSDVITRLTTRFRIPLEAVGAVLFMENFKKSYHNYATQFISLSSTNYQAVWWKLFHCPDTTN